MDLVWVCDPFGNNAICLALSPFWVYSAFPGRRLDDAFRGMRLYNPHSLSEHRYERSDESYSARRYSFSHASKYRCPDLGKQNGPARRTVHVRYSMGL